MISLRIGQAELEYLKLSVDQRSCQPICDDNTATVISGSGTLLEGQVLIEGGFFGGHAENTAEIYNPAMHTFTSTSTMNFAHGEASAARIP
jgi:hypothetical protein